MNTLVRSYRIRVYPNAAQARLIGRYLGAARWLWNTALEVLCIEDLNVKALG